ncbi:MAG: glycoside-pentoside-hexuronide (GPH):cation symporter [Eubacteriales bacterium]|nr:glycoside-pentoside-hexuronide (GPH):cation symporter [Eubacteriales bacterium]
MEQQEKKNKISKKLLLAWPTRTISTSVAAALAGYITFFATDYMGISALTAGMIFMISKIFDGFTDVVAGFLIDKTRTKLGKGRPYELALVGYWVCLVLLFAAPEMGLSHSCIYLFVMYSLINSVFMTFLGCNEAVYLSNVLEDPDQSVTIGAVSGFISLIFTMIASMALPVAVATVGVTREGWLLISVVMAVPFTLFGLIRFALIKEKRQSAASAAEAEKFTLRDMFSCLIQNKYILFFALIILLSNLGSNLVNSAQTYYFQYVMGDLGLASVMSLSMLAIIIVMILTPFLSNKFGFVNVMRATTLLGMAGYLVRLIAPTNLVLLFVSNIFAMMGFYTMFGFAGTFVIDCIDYGEWKTGRRSEGTIACAQSVTAKIGTAVGAGAIGVLMGMSGYDGALDVQPASANTMIILLYSVIPAAFCLIQFILLKIYDLDKYLPQIRRELKERAK